MSTPAWRAATAEKIDAYLIAGVAVVWVIDPVVEIFRSTAEPELVTVPRFHFELANSFLSARWFSAFVGRLYFVVRQSQWRRQ